MIFRKPPGGGLFGLGSFLQQQNNTPNYGSYDILSSPLFQPNPAAPQGNNLLPGEWDWQKKKPPVVDLLTGLANMFGTPKNQPEFGIPQPDFGFDLPTTTPPIIAQAPQDKGGWNDWMTNWNLQRSDLGDLPEYPQANDPFALGKQTGDMIRKTWHDVHKDYAFNTIQENFPSFGAPEPQPDESYHGYFDRVGQKVQEANPYQLTTMRRFSADEQPINLAQSQPSQPQSTFMEGDTGLPQYNINDDFSASVQPQQQGKYLYDLQKRTPINKVPYDPNGFRQVAPDYTPAQLQAADRVIGAEKMVTNLYFPGGGYKKSGLTGAGGVDFGQKSPREIQTLGENAGMAQDRIDILKRAAQLKGQSAVQTLEDDPDLKNFNFTPDELHNITKASLDMHKEPVDAVNETNPLPDKVYAASVDYAYLKGVGGFNDNLAEDLSTGNYDSVYQTLTDQADEALKEKKKGAAERITKIRDDIDAARPDYGPYMREFKDGEDQE